MGEREDDLIDELVRQLVAYGREQGMSLEELKKEVVEDLLWLERQGFIRIENGVITPGDPDPEKKKEFDQLLKVKGEDFLKFKKNGEG